uniref:Uncharacterized protein n=1 Tax=Noccaea caerulescens TaxID=107243 RepID=A0A1J3ERV0_NOCCA
MDAAPSILRHYNYRMVNHTRPSLKFPTDVELFDNFIERLAAIVPLAACFPYPPSYVHFNSKLGDRKVFRPTPADIVALKIETLEVHCVVITGRGVVCIDGEYVEYWQIQETRGKRFAENGFTRFERGKGLIRQVYEFVRQ